MLENKTSGQHTFIPITRPWLDEEEAMASSRVIQSGWVTQGVEVAEFEKEFAALVASRHACAVSNCTAALHLALLVAGVSSGSEVITVSHSFIATANSIRYCGAIPVFIDIQPGTYNIDPDRIADAVTNRTSAILCVHQMGMPCDLKAIMEVAKHYSIPVIEDAACAIGSEIMVDGSWSKIGKPHGDIACFSFHPRKILTTGEGGMITTSRESWDKQLRLLRQHGMSVSDQVRHGSNKVIFESYLLPGYNYRMTDIQAAIGRVQLKRLRQIVDRRRFLVRRYRQLLEKISDLTLPEEPDWAQSNWQSYCVRLPDYCDQKNVMQKMLDAGIGTRRGIMCAHRELAYTQQKYPAVQNKSFSSNTNSVFDLKQSEIAQDHTILLPLFHEMTEKEQDKVVSVLIDICSS
jgi:dTDP-4-amino-4,6-dideoxygalactose transaminase